MIDEAAFEAHRRSVRPLLDEGLTAPGEWRLLPTAANRDAGRRRLPARARRHRGSGLQARRAADRGRSHREITTFDAKLLDAFGLPPTL
jgi:hypothetical protein